MREGDAMRRGIRGERGVALPMAMFSLLLLTSLSVAFLTLGQTEPVVSNNHLRSAMARVLAEAGVERAIWALSNTTSSGLTEPAAGATAASPYDGLTFHTVTTGRGGFTVKITGVSTTEMQVETQGWTPIVGLSTVSGYDASDTRTKSHRKVLTNLLKFPDYGINTDCALCVKGDLEVTGSSKIDSTADTSCGAKKGVTTSGTLTLGSGDILGADGNSIENEATDYNAGVAASTFDSYTLSSNQLEALRQMAKLQGTYYSGSTSPCSSGTCSFNNSNQLPSGKSIVFVDGNYDASGNPYEGGTYTGWLIVVGSAAVNGNGTLNGLLYATNDITSSSGTNVINGLVVSQNTSNASGIDSSAGGNMTVNFNCNYARGNDQVPRQWFPKPGSWTEPSG